jgi:hypothetical protein
VPGGSGLAPAVLVVPALVACLVAPAWLQLGSCGPGGPYTRSVPNGSSLAPAVLVVLLARGLWLSATDANAGSGSGTLTPPLSRGLWINATDADPGEKRGNQAKNGQILTQTQTLTRGPCLSVTDANDVSGTPTTTFTGDKRQIWPTRPSEARRI